MHQRFDGLDRHGGQMREGCDEIAVLTPGREAIDGGVVELSVLVQLDNFGLRFRIIDFLRCLRDNSDLDTFNGRYDRTACLGRSDPEEPRANRPWKFGQQFAKYLC